MLAIVNSSATMERQPEVPNLMGVAILVISVPCCTVILPQTGSVGKRGMDRGVDCSPADDRGGGLISFGLAVLMRWLVIGLLVSVGALLLVAGGVARHVWRHRRLLAEESAEEAQRAQNLELDLALDLHETVESKQDSIERPAR
jgi:cell division protein FtsL